MLRIMVLRFTILSLAGCIFAFCICSSGLAFEMQSTAVSSQEMQDIYIDEEEEKAYRAAKKEPDPKERASKLFEFYQKYPESVLLRPADFEEIKAIINAHNDYHTARNEPDLEKRAAMLIKFLQQYPDSILLEYIDVEYMEILKELWQEKKYELLGSLSEKWLKIYPKNKEARTFLAGAATNLLQFEKCAESLEVVYEVEPSPNLAREIHNCYQKTENLAKRVEWADRLFKMPEFESDYVLRFDCMTKFYEESNLPKAAECAELALESAGLAEQRDPGKHEQLQKVRRACYHIVASDLMGKGNYDEAIKYFQKAVRAEQYWEGYYEIGMCLDYQKKMEEAMVYYAMAEIVDGENESKAKSRLEIIYRALHNQTLIGIEKVYTKAKELLAVPTGQ